MFLAPMPSWEGGRVGDTDMWKRRLSTLCSWLFGTSQLLNQVNEHCNGRCPRVYSMPMLYPYEHSADSVVTYIHIGVGLLHCSFNLIGQCEGLEERDE